MGKTTAPAAARQRADVGFHAGELAVQRRAGTAEEAARLSPMLDPAELRGGLAAFLARRTFAVITARDAGGRPGFVRVDGGRLWWRDYPGNNLFNSFGNLAVNPQAALLFADFDTGDTLHLSGTAEVEWDERGRPGDEGHTGRRAVFTPERLVAGNLLPSRQVAHSPNPRNPALTD